MNAENVTIYTLMKLNELAERYGVPPYEFIAELTEVTRGEQMGTELLFTAFPNDPKYDRKFERMLNAIGMSSFNHGTFYEDDGELCRVLESAIAKAPSKLGR